LKQKLIIFVVFVLMAAILAGLNAASYTQRQKNPESELSPNRSTFNSGPTGTQAFYSLLSETGRKVVRWQEPTDELETRRRNIPATFVVIGPFRREYKEPEFAALLRWVFAGGRLVVIDREPPADLIKTTAKWKIDLNPQNRLKLLDSDPSDPKQMTADTPAAKPTQPSVFTSSVNAVQTSQFASSVEFEPVSGGRGSGNTIAGPPPPPRKANALPTAASDDEDESSPSLLAPVVHLASNGKNLLVDVPYGHGRIVYLSDPYVISNGGIALVDNAQIGINIVSSGDGIIAFDEYHQGFGGNNNRFFEFFAGTPVIAIFFQCVALVGFLFFSQSRRFGRPLPADEPDRLSKLEYVGAMAELQQRTRAFDLAIENIYRDFRRRAARHVGVDSNSVSRPEFAARIAERAKLEKEFVEDLMFKCDEIIIGEPTNKREVLGLVSRIRDVERALGLRRRSGK
jgi:hypothetical protein